MKGIKSIKRIISNLAKKMKKIKFKKIKFCSCCKKKEYSIKSNDSFQNVNNILYNDRGKLYREYEHDFIDNDESSVFY